jgi:RNA polymerase sigma factor (sigma-70 family)
MSESSAPPPAGLKDSALEQELSGLMRRAQDGDPHAYRTLLIRLQALAERYVRRALGGRLRMESSQCEDVVQDILLGVHTKRHTHDPVRYFLPWFYAIARYKVIDEIRRLKSARQTQSLSDEPDPGTDGPDIATVIDVRRMLRTLPLKQRRVLRMVKLEGMSVEETSGRTGYSQTDVRVSVHRALKALRRQVEPATERDGG